MTSFSPPEEVRTEEEQLSWLKRPVIRQVPTLSVETIIITLILILAVFSRFYLLGERVMSHDETNHVVPSYDLYQGRGYRHDPITHGPFQFHIIALTYFMLGDNDFTSRLPAAVFSIATVAFACWGFRRYLGRTGALIAAFLMLISPYILFYGRYTRNEAFVGLSGLVMIYAILRYLETGRDRFGYLLTLTTVFHFIVKETAYIYAAQALLFLGGLFLYRVLRRPWRNPAYKQYFTLSLLVGAVLIGAALVFAVVSRPVPAVPPAPGAPAASPTPAPAAPASIPPLALGLGGIGLLELVLTGFFLVKGYTLAAMRQERSFDLLILLGSLVLPLLVPIPVKLLGWNPLDYSDAGILHTSLVLVPVVLAAIAIGVWWRPRFWLASAALFYTVFIVFYTTFFTNGTGFLTGLVGSLGYWLDQQGVQRGSQPWYYFAFIQIPIYEFLPALGTLAAFVLALRHPVLTTVPEQREELPGFLGGTPESALPGTNGQGEALEGGEQAAVEPGEKPQPTAPRETVPVIALLLFWAVTSLIAFSYAGEKMPWLTVHITLVMIMAAGWAFGYLVDTTPWKLLWERKGVLVLLLLPVFITSLAGMLLGLLGTQPPFQGNELVQLQNTATFLFSAIMVLASGAGLLYLTRPWTGFETGRAAAVVFFMLLAVLTARAAIRASYIDYDTAKEYLVYAHAARGPKDALADVEDISRRLTGDPRSIAVAYDNENLYPYWWYFRNFPNHVWFADKPTRELRNNPVIIVGDTNYSKIEPIVGNAYNYYETMRLWWPNQDYFNLTWERIRDALTNPAIRAGVWQIWFNRDYTQYAQATNNQNLTLTTWVPSNKMRVYIRKDIVSQIWKYGAAPAAPVVADPYEKGTIKLSADQMLGTAGNQPGQFDAPRGIAVADDGSLYVADSRNHRIQHLDPNGNVINMWGSFADATKGDAPGGTFNEPWDVAVGKDGSVYVADTWNNRIQKFTSEGEFVKMWGYFGQAEQPDAFWGPRGLAVNPSGQLLVTDTGNKRVVVFDPDGNFVTQFGSIGVEPGQLDEPVGIAVDAQGAVYVADTWNQRIQVFTPDPAGTTYTPTKQWEVAGWFGQSLDNKPYLAVDSQGHVFTSDPESFRILEFTTTGEFVRTWGDNSTEADGFGLAAGVAVDAQGNVWASDAGNMRIMHFPVPQ